MVQSPGGAQGGFQGVSSSPAVPLLPNGGSNNSQQIENK